MLKKKMTGPYHTIYSLYGILKNYDDFRFTVLTNKKILKKNERLFELT